MTSNSDRTLPADWLTLPDVVDRLGEPLGRVRRLVDEKHLLSSRRFGPVAVPAAFLNGDEPLGSLRGTVIVLLDAGFSDDEAIDWLLNEDETIGARPIDALHAGRKSEVRRQARVLA